MTPETFTVEQIIIGKPVPIFPRRVGINWSVYLQKREILFHNDRFICSKRYSSFHEIAELGQKKKQGKKNYACEKIEDGYLGEWVRNKGKKENYMEIWIEYCGSRSRKIGDGCKTISRIIYDKSGVHIEKDSGW